jgi:hypothetical protein
MPNLSQAVTTTTTTEVKLSSSVRKKLLTAFKVYAELSAQKKAIKLAMEKQAHILAGIREDLGEESISIEGNTTTLVAGLYKKFNPKKFVMLGGELALYEQAIEEKPKKSYEKVTVAGAKDDDDE